MYYSRIILIAEVGLGHTITFPQLHNRIKLSMSAWWGCADSGSTKKIRAPRSSMHINPCQKLRGILSCSLALGAPAPLLQINTLYYYINH